MKLYNNLQIFIVHITSCTITRLKEKSNLVGTQIMYSCILAAQLSAALPIKNIIFITMESFYHQMSSNHSEYLWPALRNPIAIKDVLNTFDTFH